MRAMAVCGVLLALGAGCTGANAGTGSAPSAGEADPGAGRVTDAAPASPAPSADASWRPGTLSGTSWRSAETDAAAPPGSSPTLTFDSPQHAAGSTGCNRFSGAVTMDGGSLRFGRLMTTRRGCPAPVMEREKRFLGALEACRSWRKMAGSRGVQTLELLDESGTVVLRLEAAPASGGPS